MQEHKIRYEDFSKQQKIDKRIFKLNKKIKQNLK